MTVWASSGFFAAHSLFQKSAVIGVALASAGRLSGRRAMPRSSASVGKGSETMPASTAPDSSAGTMSGKGMILTWTSLSVRPSVLSASSIIHSTAAPRMFNAIALPLRSPMRLMSLPQDALRTVK